MKIENEREDLEKIISSIGSKTARYEFDEKYNLAVHNIIWNDLTLAEKVKHKIGLQKSKIFSLVRHSFPPSLVKKYDETRVLLDRQRLASSIKMNTKVNRSIR